MPACSRVFITAFVHWLSSYDTNAIRTAGSSRACHSCRSRSKVGHNIRCGRTLMRRPDSGSCSGPGEDWQITFGEVLA